MATSKVAYLVKPKIVDGVEGEAIVEFRDIEIPTPGPGEILVKVEGCGICGTDVHEYRYNPFGYKETRSNATKGGLLRGTTLFRQLLT